MEETVDREKRLFTERFNSRLEYWMKVNHKTQDDFRNEAEIGSKNTVTSWKQGKSFPRDSQMDAICRILGCEADVFKPFFPAEKERFRNTETIARAAELERYAREKGLKEATYQHIIHLPDFMRIFPFHGLRGKYGVRHYRRSRKRGEPAFALVKFQFEDDYGHRFMMDEADIDFLAVLQGKSERMIRMLCLEEKDRMTQEQIRKEIDQQIQHYPGISRDEVEEKAEAVNVLDPAGATAGCRVSQAVRDLALEKGVQPQIRIQEIEKAVQMARMPAKTAIEWYSMNGLTGNEIRDQLKQDEKKAMEEIRYRAERYRKNGFKILDGSRKEGI